MTAHALTDDAPAAAQPDVWDTQRLTSLIADVGEAGLRDILRLFMADMPFLQAQLASACAAGNETGAQTVLAVVQDSAETLGLAALAALVRRQRGNPLEPGNTYLLAQEIARIRFVPTLKHAS